MIGLLAALIAAGAVAAPGPARAGARIGAARPRRGGCAAPRLPATREPSNPLMLTPAPSGGDPLRGAHFYVPGPARGAAAGAIARLLGLTSAPLGSGRALAPFSDSLSWAAFSRTVAEDLPHASPRVARQVRLLERIAAEPQAQRVSRYSQGGTPAGIFAQTEKIFCTLLQADPHTIPIISTYFLHPELGGCATRAEIDADAPNFRAQIDAMAQAIGRRPAVLLLELDAVGSSSCIARHGGLGAWEGLMRFEALTLEALPHTAVYLEGGYSDSNSPAYAARMLNAAGVRLIQGFFTNDTHNEWTSDELRYAKAVSARTGGAHFIINTATNGRGPLLNRHPRTQGIEALCNPPGRGLGIPDTTTPGLNSHLDALLWTFPPGNSSGSCHGGPPSGTFWVARAISLAAHANDQLGPGYPSRPY